jgi:hypothetical protein
MEAGAELLQGVAVATDAYQDDTGATRAGTVAYVASARGGGATAVRRAAAEVRRLRFDDNQVELDQVAGPTGHDLTIVLTVPTRYVLDLETERAGAHAFIRPTILGQSGRVFELVMAEIRQVFE